VIAKQIDDGEIMGTKVDEGLNAIHNGGTPVN
ncbi:uncharacterized protein METZ01_LOCUS293503, partial [marine metagenome]